MATRDVRKLAGDAIYELRLRAVKLKESGHTHAEVAEALDTSVAAVRVWWGLYKDGGVDAMRLKQRGRRHGSGRILTPRQESAICKTIEDKNPEQLKMPFALWTAPVVARWILKRFGVRIPDRTMRLYLQRWGYTPQRPKRHAIEQQPGLVREWMETSYPAIAERAKAEKAEVLWGDETGISNQDSKGRGYAPVGKTPVARGMAKKVTTSMISAVGNRGDVRFMIYKGALDVAKFLMFLKRLVKDAKKKVFLILDNLRVHKARRVTEWVMENSERIELFYLPPYSPELNPDEYLNNTVKSQVRNQPVAQSHDELQASLRKVMLSNQRKPSIIRALFRHPSVAYDA
jgi:transposase